MTPRSGSEKGILMGNLLDGRVAIVTGAGRGIGAGIARLLGSEGAQVVVNDLGVQLDGSGADTGPAAQLVKETRAAGGEAIANSADVADFGAAESLIRSPGPWDLETAFQMIEQNFKPAVSARSA
jgi:NAD(P)-dependent dehydrogenase (short-subunit alcohol dehydrogenase family)